MKGSDKSILDILHRAKETDKKLPAHHKPYNHLLNVLKNKVPHIFKNEKGNQVDLNPWQADDKLYHEKNKI